MITTGEKKHILIDSGPRGAVLPALAKELPILKNTLELIILTHPDLDHIGAFPEILDRYSIGAALLPAIADTLTEYQSTINTLHDRHIPIIFADPAVDIRIDNVILDTLWPPARALADRGNNNRSLVIRAQYPCGSVLFTGDIEGDAEAEILRTGIVLQANILKVAHHGSKTSSSTGFLLTVHPNIAVISSGKRNPYGHPHPQTLDRFMALGIHIKRTDREGSLTLDLQECSS